MHKMKFSLETTAQETLVEKWNFLPVFGVGFVQCGTKYISCEGNQCFGNRIHELSYGVERHYG